MGTFGGSPPWPVVRLQGVPPLDLGGTHREIHGAHLERRRFEIGGGGLLSAPPEHCWWLLQSLNARGLRGRRSPQYNMFTINPLARGVEPCNEAQMKESAHGDRPRGNEGPTPKP
ncbi:hypothetical protein NDU88_005337 [Pleurodeles waltl]|uniref:Uncharacterized protein n=1 Tax=Pleurodeles waltl TaxID=8319 RepID=A0AAV7LX25_PLEWA|nr:hypothetical protein NDU88_005337 [Pleurodeles waltl]